MEIIKLIYTLRRKAPLKKTEFRREIAMTEQTITRETFLRMGDVTRLTQESDVMPGSFFRSAVQQCDRENLRPFLQTDGAPQTGTDSDDLADLTVVTDEGTAVIPYGSLGRFRDVIASMKDLIDTAFDELRHDAQKKEEELARDPYSASRQFQTDPTNMQPMVYAGPQFFQPSLTLNSIFHPAADAATASTESAAQDITDVPETEKTAETAPEGPAAPQAPAEQADETDDRVPTAPGSNAETDQSIPYYPFNMASSNNPLLTAYGGPAFFRSFPSAPAFVPVGPCTPVWETPDQKECPNCGARVGDVPFCPKCGSELVKPTTTPIICSQCGLPSEHEKFCSQCGAILKKRDPQPDMPAEPGPAVPPTAEPEPAAPPTAEPEPVEPPTAEPEPVEPTPAEPEPTVPQTAEPEPVEPTPAEPEPTVPQTVEPGEPSSMEEQETEAGYPASLKELEMENRHVYAGPVLRRNIPDSVQMNATGDRLINPGMQFCRNCGKQTRVGDRFCRECGAKQDV